MSEQIILALKLGIYLIDFMHRCLLSYSYVHFSE